MSKSRNHSKGDSFRIKKNRSGSERFPRKEWREDKLLNKHFRRMALLEEIKSV